MLDIHELKTTSRVCKSNLIFVVLIPIYSDFLFVLVYSIWWIAYPGMDNCYLFLLHRLGRPAFLFVELCYYCVWVSTRLPTPLSTILLPKSSVFVSISLISVVVPTQFCHQHFIGQHMVKMLSRIHLSQDKPLPWTVRIWSFWFILISKKTANSYFSRQSAT
jgi:hypothetical protein